MQDLIRTEDIDAALKRMRGVVERTILHKSINLSEQYNCNLYLKREDRQVVRSYKIRGAYNLISSLPAEKLKKGVVCASAGNHAQGVAYSCNLLRIKGTVFMPNTTPKQKINQVKMFGKEHVETVLLGDTFDDSYKEAMAFSKKNDTEFIHPFDDLKIVEGQGTVAAEILNEHHHTIDYVFLPVGGGGLASGLGSYFKQKRPDTEIIGVEPEGAPAMSLSVQQDKVITLTDIDKFVDGAAVKKVGEKTFGICKKVLDDILLVPEGKVCSTIISLYNQEAIVVEPAGSLSIAALDQYKEKIKGKTVVCVISGGNNDIGRMEEIKERSLMYEGLKHYFIVNFPQRAGALREFLDEVLGPYDDITRFEYIKKSSKESGPALVGIELKYKEDYNILLERMEKKRIDFTLLNKSPDLFKYFL